MRGDAGFTTSVTHSGRGGLRDTGIAYLSWAGCLVGLFGLHRFYMGKWGTGLLWFCTLGLLFVGQAIDLFLLGNAVDRHNDRAVARGEGGWFVDGQPVRWVASAPA